MAKDNTVAEHELANKQARIEDIKQAKQDTGCHQQEQTTISSHSNSQKGYNLSGEINANGSGKVGYKSTPEAELSGDAKGQIGGHYQNNVVNDEKTEAIIKGEGCNTELYTALDEKQGELQKDVVELKGQMETFDSVQKAIDGLPENKDPCLAETDTDTIFKDHVTICRTDYKGNIDREGNCLTSEYTTDNLPEFLERGKEINCSGKMDPIDLSQAETQDTEVLLALVGSGQISREEMDSDKSISAVNKTDDTDIDIT